MHALYLSRIVFQHIQKILLLFTARTMSGILFVVSQIYAANIYALTFDWEAATENGVTVTQVVSGFTATVSTSNADADLVGGGGIGGSAGNIATVENLGLSTSLSVTFDSPVDLATAFVFDINLTGGNWVFTPIGGSNSAVPQTIGATGTTVNLNWADVTGFTITNSTGLSADFGLDDLIFSPPASDPPVVQSIAVSGAPSANAVSMVYTVVFNENANNVSTDDFTLTTVTGSAAAQIASVSSSTGSSIDVTVNNITGAGDLRLDLNTSTDIIDDAGNGSVAAFNMGAVHTVDAIGPRISSIERFVPSASPTTADTLTWRITFNESVSNIDETDFSVSGATASINVSTATGTVVDVTASGGDLSDLDANVILSLNGTQNLIDAVGNALSNTLPTGVNDNDFDVISDQTDALNIISATANNAIAPAPDENNYSNAGVTDVTTQILDLVNIAVANATSSIDVDSAIEIQVLVDVVLNGQDTDGDGIPNFLEGASINLDTDGDGVFDFLDQDADNDGITDLLEAGIDLTDTDNDGIADVFDSDIDNNNNGADAGKADANFDGVDDSFATIQDVAADQDNDGIPNHQDLDSDNDSLLDITETDGLDANADGLLDAAGVLATAPLRNDDGDVLPNYLDITSNGINFDIALIGLTQFDTDNNGIVDNTIDMDKDGIIDDVDNAVGAFGSLNDIDGDGIPNHIDDDDDNDGILDTEENPRQSDFTGLDADADGIDDGVDANVNGVLTGVDVDGNGVQDGKELPDLDGDGLADHLDNDSDNDGINDAIDPTVALEEKKKSSGGGFTSLLTLVMLLSLIGLRRVKLA